MEFKTNVNASKVVSAVIASVDAFSKTATVTVKRIKRVVRRDPKTVALGVLTGTVFAGFITGVTAIAISVPNQPKTDFSEMAVATTTTAVTTYAPEVDIDVEEAVTTTKATTTTKTTTEAAKEEVTTTKAVTTTAPVQEEPEVVTNSEPAVVIPDRSDDEMPIDFVRYEEETEAEVEEPEAEAEVEETEAEEESDYVAYDDLDASLNAILSSEDKYLLCNIVGHEYGSDYVPVSEKARIAAVIMNRVYNDGTHHEFDSVNSVSEVLAQPGQFTVWLPNDQYIYQVTDSVKEAVLYYFQNSDSETYKYDYYYYGDGNWNYFRCYY